MNRRGTQRLSFFVHRFGCKQRIVGGSFSAYDEDNDVLVVELLQKCFVVNLAFVWKRIWPCIKSGNSLSITALLFISLLGQSLVFVL